jgi:hypothetical protein
MNTSTPTPSQLGNGRSEWVEAANKQADAVRRWAEEEGWDVELSSGDGFESAPGEHGIPVLTIRTPEGRVVFEPVAREILGATGRIDLYAWPTLFRVMLIRRLDGNWIIRTESGLNWPHEWNRETFLELAEGLVRAE